MGYEFDAPNRAERLIAQFGGAHAAFDHALTRINEKSNRRDPIAARAWREIAHCISERLVWKNGWRDLMT